MMMSNMSSVPSRFREEIQTLTKKCQELEEIRREERNDPVERSPEVWLSGVSDLLCGHRGALGRALMVLRGLSPAVLTPTLTVQFPFIIPVCLHQWCVLNLGF